MFAKSLDNEFAREVRAGLTRTDQKTLPCRYLYDDVGSALFEAITYLDEYGLTRADARVIQKHAGDLVELLPPDVVTVELGSGTGVKTRAILERLSQRESVSYFPIDLAETALEKCRQDLGWLATVSPIHGTYLEGLRKVAAQRSPGQTLMVLFLGSTIGNFAQDEAINFLYDVRQCLQAGDVLLLGTDLVKPVKVLRAAYDDAAGVTRAFNLNLLARINRELGADFDLRQFEHVARYDEAAQRIEMHLRSRVRQTVQIPEADLTVKFLQHETIFTEACHKFRPEQICGMARAAGFHLEAQWIDQQWPFAESLLAAV